MDNKELLKQLKNCIDLCDKWTKEKEELKIELEDQIRVSDELESLLKEANDSIVSTVDIIGNINKSVNEFREGVLIYQNYVMALMDELYDKVKQMNENQENRENELEKLKEDVEKAREEIIKLNKDLSWGENNG